MKRLALALSLLVLPALAHAQDINAPLVLKSSVTDGDGKITVADLFDNPGAFGSIVLAQRTGATAVLDAAAVQGVVNRAGAYWDNPKGLHRIIVSAGPDGLPADDAAMTPVASQSPAQAPAATHNQQVLVFTHPMNTGDVVQAEDLQFAEVAAVASGTVSNAQTAIGKTVRYPLRQGAAVRTSDLTSPVVVKRAEQVQVTWASDSMSLSMTGIAQKDAATGDLIQIQNPTSKKLIDAVVTGPGEALAGPAADRIRQGLLLSSR